MIKKILSAMLFWCLCSATAGALAAPLQIFVSIPPQKWLSDQLGGPLVSTHVLVDKGQEPHMFQPTPRQLTDLFHAQLYFTLELPFERKISRKIRQSSTQLQLVDVTSAIQRIPMVGRDEGRHQTEPAARHKENLDPHVWLAPANLKIMAEAMATAMIHADPANIASYDKNLRQVKNTLDQLNRDISQMLAPCRGSIFYVFHPAFGYFAHAYDLHQEAVELEGKSPSPKQLSSLIKQARKDKVKIIFVQPEFDEKSAQAVARAIGGSVVPLDPLAEDITTNLKIIAEKIQSALRGNNK